MDFDDAGPLNLAHRYERQAEDDEKKKLFDSAIQLRLKALHKFNDALALAKCPRIRESIQAQVSSNLTLIEDLKKRKDHRHKEIMDERKAAVESNKEGVSIRKTASPSFSGDKLETKIYRVIEEHDSLLQLLAERSSSPTNINTSTSTLSGSAYKTGNKIPKGDKTVIEELKTSNEHLRLLVYQLIGELEKTQLDNKLLVKEIESLKSNANNQPDDYSTSSLPPLPQPPFNIIY